VRVVAVGTGTPDAAKRFAIESKFPGLILSDQSRKLYKAFNCRRGLVRECECVCDW
jgi:peroxiredoxin